MTILTIVLSTILLLVLWYLGHPSVIDRGGDRKFWNAHSKYHILGGFLLAILPSYADGYFFGVLASFLPGLELEIAQQFPRDKQGGYFEEADLAWDMLGAILGAAVGTLIRINS